MISNKDNVIYLYFYSYFVIDKSLRKEKILSSNDKIINKFYSKSGYASYSYLIKYNGKVLEESGILNCIVKNRSVANTLSLLLAFESILKLEDINILNCIYFYSHNILNGNSVNYQKMKVLNIEYINEFKRIEDSILKKINKCNLIYKFEFNEKNKKYTNIHNDKNYIKCISNCLDIIKNYKKK